MFVIKTYWQKIIDILAVQNYFKVQSACVYIIRFIERDAFLMWIQLMCLKVCQTVWLVLLILLCFTDLYEKVIGNTIQIFFHIIHV